MKAEFKKEWTAADFKQVQKRICNWIASRHFETHHSPEADPFTIAGARSFAAIDNILGLAYTSTGIWACYGVCNTRLFLDAGHKFSADYFTIDRYGFVYAVCQDDAENEIYIPI